jgi:Ca2+/H+ antiporter
LIVGSVIYSARQLVDQLQLLTNIYIGMQISVPYFVIPYIYIIPYNYADIIDGRGNSRHHALEDEVRVCLEGLELSLQHSHMVACSVSMCSCLQNYCTLYSVCSVTDKNVTFSGQIPKAAVQSLFLQ